MRYNKYHWLLLTLFLLIICLFASAEKKEAEKIGVIKGFDQDSPNSLSQTDDKTNDQSQISDQESTQSVKRAGAELNWQVISTGGNRSLSGDITLNGTTGQTAVFSAGVGDIEILHGFWQRFEIIGSCDCEPGECDGKAGLNILDIVYLINYKYKNGPVPVPYELCSGDLNLDCIVNILDIVYLINFIYKDGSSPGSCRDWVLECSLPLRN